MDNFREWLSDNLRYILLGLFIILALAVLFLGIRFISAKVGGTEKEVKTEQESQTDSNQKDTSPKDASSVGEQPQTTVQAEPKVAEVSADEKAKVDSVIQTYYTALGGKDIAGIKTVVDELDATEEAKITRDPYIVSYDNVETYTVSGLESGTYIVFAKYTYRFKDIDTDVPGLSQMYVRTGENGKLYITTKPVDEKTASFINQSMEEEKVQTMLRQVNESYEKALESDENLKTFLDGLGIGTSEAMSAEDGATVTVAAECNVRAKPNEEAEILGKLGEGQKVTKAGSQDNWIQIEYEGQTGYVRSDLFQ